MTNGSSQAMKINTQRLVLTTSVISALLNIAATKHNCTARVVESQLGFALLTYTYKSVSKDSYQPCLDECQNNELCMSLNYILSTNQCQLNTQSKESRPQRYVTKVHSIYCTNNALRIPESAKGMKGLPGKSCEDILESGEFVGNGTYWLHSNKTENPIKVICRQEITGVMVTKSFKNDNEKDNNGSDGSDDDKDDDKDDDEDDSDGGDD